MPPGSRSLFQILVAVAGAVLVAFIYLDASRRGQPIGEYLAERVGMREPEPVEPSDAAGSGTRTQFLEPRAIGHPADETPPWITHVTIVDLDQDARYSLASILRAAGRTDEAIRQYRVLLALRPSHEQAAQDLRELTRSRQ